MPRLDAEPIASLQNAQVRYARSLLDSAGRRRHKAFLVEGLRLLEAAAAVAAPRLVLHTPDFGQTRPRERSLLRHLRATGATVRAVTERVLGHVTDTVTPQGIVAVMPLPDDAAPAAPSAEAGVTSDAGPGTPALGASDPRRPPAARRRAGSRANPVRAGALAGQPPPDAGPWRASPAVRQDPPPEGQPGWPGNLAARAAAPRYQPPQPDVPAAATPPRSTTWC